MSQVEDLFLLDSEGLERSQLLTVFRAQKCFDKNLREGIVGVLLVERRLYVRSELLGLLLKLVDRDLAYEEREVFRGGVIIHSDMSLVGPLKLFFLSDIILFAAWLLGVLAAITLRPSLLRVDLANETGVVSKQFLSFYFVDSIDGDVGSLVLESTMDVDIRVHNPTGVTEALDGLKLIPLRRFCVVYFEGNVFSYLVGTSSDDHHEGANEKSRVLVARSGSLTIDLVRGFDPVPTAITMSTEAPSITEGSLIGSASTEGYHHACSSSSVTESSGVVDSHGRAFLSAV
jgi:hypothetical protein